MQEITLKYGANPNQSGARVFTEKEKLPFEVLNGKVGYINLLDAFNGWQLVRELRQATGLAAAASFKHVSPAGAAVGVPFDETLGKAYFTSPKGLSPLAFAYARARGADRMSSYCDFAAMSDIVDVPTAKILSREASDGVVAPGYEPEALEILKNKRGGNYCVLQIDKDYAPEGPERRSIFGVSLEQGRNDAPIDEKLFANIVSKNKNLPQNAVRDLIISMITLKYTQSNSICYVLDGQAIGIGAGQQSRIHCTRLAGLKADIWFLRQHPAMLGLAFRKGTKRPDQDNLVDQLLQDDAEEAFADEASWSHLLPAKPRILSRGEKKEWIKKLSGVSLGSDAFFPFGDNIERAHQSGVQYVAEAGGSIRDDNVIEVCDKYGMVLAFTGLRLFHH